MSPNVMQPRRSLPYSQHPVTYPFPEPDQSSLGSAIHYSLRSILILSSYQSRKFPSGNFAAALPAKTLYKILFFLIATTKKNKLSHPIT
jgi:hypothetical protein